MYDKLYIYIGLLRWRRCSMIFIINVLFEILLRTTNAHEQYATKMYNTSTCISKAFFVHPEKQHVLTNTTMLYELNDTLSHMEPSLYT